MKLKSRSVVTFGRAVSAPTAPSHVMIFNRPLLIMTKCTAVLGSHFASRWTTRSHWSGVDSHPTENPGKVDKQPSLGIDSAGQA